jgi:hypothetical protein
MYGNMRRVKSSFRKPEVLKEELRLQKPLAEIKAAFVRVVADTRGHEPSLKYATSVFIKAAKNLLQIQELDSSVTADSFVDVVLNHYSMTAIASMTLLSSDSALHIALCNGAKRRVFLATLVVAQLDSLMDLGKWMSLVNMLKWADSNNYSPVTLYLLGVALKDEALTRKYGWAVENDHGRTEKLPEVVALVPSRYALLQHNPAKPVLEAHSRHDTIAPPPVTMDAQCQ